MKLLYFATLFFCALVFNDLSSMSNETKEKLFEYVKNNELEKLKLLFANVAIYINTNEKEDDEGLLHVATLKNNFEMMQFLLDQKNIDVNIKNSVDQTPLHYSAHHGNFEITKLLLKQKSINVNVQETSAGYTPLMMAIFRGHKRLAYLIMQHKTSNLAIQNYVDQTFLHIAAFNKFADAIRYILNEKKIDIDCKDIWENTALHYAVHEDHIESVQLLIEHGAIIFLLNSVNKRPLDYAQEKNNTSLINYLQDIESLMTDSAEKIISNEISKSAKVSMLKRVYRSKQFKTLLKLHVILEKRNKLRLFKTLIHECKFLTWKKKEIKQLRAMGLPLTKNEYDMEEKLLKHTQKSYKTDLLFELTN